MHARMLLLAMATLVLCSASADARDVVVVERGDSMHEALLPRLLKPFADATSIATQEESWDGGIDTLRSHAKAADNIWDLVEVDPEELATGCGEGLLEKLDWSAIGGKDHYLPIGVSDCGVGAAVNALVLVWDRDKFPAAPSWADFWDVAKYPGKRGLYKGVRGNLEIALMADGVAPADVYKTLATSDGVDRAFRKLDQLKPYIVWWQTGADAARILSSGDVLMSSAPSARMAIAGRKQQRNFGLQFNGSLYEVLSWAILKGSPNLRQALQLLYFAGTPAVEAQLFTASGEAGLAKGMNDFLSPEMVSLSPSLPNNLNAGLRMDVAFWHDNLAKLRQRFEAWLNAH